MNEKLSSLQKYLVLLPHAINISIPKVEIDILHADKSNNTEHNSLHFVFGCSFKFSVFLFFSSFICRILSLMSFVPNPKQVVLSLKSHQLNLLSFLVMVVKYSLSFSFFILIAYF